MELALKLCCGRKTLGLQSLLRRCSTNGNVVGSRFGCGGLIASRALLTAGLHFFNPGWPRWKSWLNIPGGCIIMSQ